MKRITATARIAMGLAGISVTLLGIAMYVSLVPDVVTFRRESRARICEVAAITGSRYITQRELRGLETTLEAIVKRHDDLLSAGVRDVQGHLQVDVGNHRAKWKLEDHVAAHESTDTQVVIPLRVDDERCGQLEFHFAPFYPPGLIGLLSQQRVWLLVFFGICGGGAYYLFLRRVLQHLDPSKVVPGRVRSALDTLSEGLLMLDKNERIVLSNESFSKLTGLSIDQLLGKRASSLAWLNPHNEAEPIDAPWLRVLQGEVVGAGHMLAFRGESGLRSFQINCSPIMSGEGYRGVLVSLEDVTQLESTKVALAKSRDEAEQANQAKSDFLARMSHEIRTPMNAILGFTDVLLRGLANGEEETQDYLGTIHASGKHLLELINDILDLSKIEAGRLEVEMVSCRPVELASHAISIMRARAEEKGLKLRLEIDGQIPVTIHSDETRVRQILMNLIGNAVKFTSEGSVTVRMSCDPSSETMIFDVIDTGIGISPQGLARIFDPFSQADNSITRRFGGTGLGLSISLRLAEALGGSLTVTSTEGQGSCFRVAITTGALKDVNTVGQTDLQLDSESKKTQQQSYRFSHGNILVADDGVSNRKLIQLVLSRAGLKVQCVENGAEAVEQAMTAQFDLVLMDMQMPVMDGYSATTKLRSLGYERPIYALTANAMHGEEQKCLAAGCSGFLTKPIDMDKILGTLAAELGSATLTNLGSASNILSADALGAAADSPDTVRVDETSSRTTPTDGTATSTSEIKTIVIADRRGKPSSTTKISFPTMNSSPRPATATGEMICSTLPMDDECFVEIVVEFVERLADQLAAMEQAIEQEDFDELAKLAHWLKGSGGTTGFAQLSVEAVELEHSAKASDRSQAGDSLQELRRLAARIAVPTKASSPA